MHTLLEMLLVWFVLSVGVCLSLGPWMKEHLVGDYPEEETESW